MSIFLQATLEIDGAGYERFFKTMAEWVPIIENSQDMPALADTVSSVLERHPQAHGFLIKRHGLYSWGKDLAQAKRHIEIIEFLLETLGQTATLKSRRS